MTSTSEFSDAVARPDSRTMAVYLSVLVAMFMAALDMNIVVTALPTIAGDLGDVSLFGWVGAAYLLTTAAVSPFYGKLGDMYGRKITLIVAVALFLAGSLACGAAWSMESLIGARVLQGLGGGGLMVSVFAIIGDLFEPRQRAKYQGYTTAVFALGGLWTGKVLQSRRSSGRSPAATSLPISAGAGSSSSTCRSGWGCSRSSRW